ncbi:MAG: hypothetical protein RLZZ127_2376, partial [Planctomycetota bacterium]
MTAANVVPLRVRPEAVAAVKARVDLAEMIGGRVKLSRDAPGEHVGLCPFHHENTPSFRVWADHYHCFGCGAHGDHMDWLAHDRGLQFREAYETLVAWTGETPATSAAPPPAVRDDTAVWRAVVPVPGDAPPLLDARGAARLYNPKRAGTDKEWTTLRPDHVAWYRDAAGGTLGAVLRVEIDDGKITPQVTWIEPTDSRSGEAPRWAMWPLPRPRPLYGLDRLAANPQAPVLLLFGEKKTEAAQAELPDVVCLSFPGGDQSRAHVDWTPLAGRRVMIWPDADASGMAAAEGGAQTTATATVWRPGVAQLLLGWTPPAVGDGAPGEPQTGVGAAAVRVVEPPADAPKGWDVADHIADGVRGPALQRWILSRLRPPAAVPERIEAAKPDRARGPRPVPRGTARQDSVAPPPPEPPLSAPPPEPPPPRGDDFGADPADELWSEHFRCLGYDRKTFFFMSTRGKQVIGGTNREISQASFLTMLAPLSWWQLNYPSRKGGMDTLQAADDVMKACFANGVWRDHAVRGRGAWWDDGRAVVHIGDRLVVDGDIAGLATFRSRHIYEQGPPLPPPAAAPLTAKDGEAFLGLCRMFSWERTLSGDLLAGWIATAPILGSLAWRSSLHLVGPSGSGKGWILGNVVQRVLGEYALNVQGNTSAAGIEQTLGIDALPVIFDEAEAEDEAQMRQMKAVLFLMRAASSSGVARQLKGSTEGKARATQMRTAFLFTSVNPVATAIADEARLTPLTLCRNDDVDRFEDIRRAARDLLTPDFGRRLVARMVARMGIVRETAEVFAQAFARAHGDRRVGDQIGTMLAGAWALVRDRAITADEAEAWLQGRDFRDHSTLGEAPEWRRFLDRLLTAPQRVSFGGAMQDRALGELVGDAKWQAGLRPGDEGFEARFALDHCIRLGIRPWPADDGTHGLMISTTHERLRELLRGT